MSKDADVVRPKEHILVTTAPVCPDRIGKIHPLLVGEFPQGTLKCARFSGESVATLFSNPCAVVVVDLDSLDDNNIRCLLSTRQGTQESFYVYSRKQRSMELVIPGCKPGTCAVTLPRSSSAR